jgi:hypothetical protein
MNHNDYRALAYDIGKLFARYGCEANIPQWLLIHVVTEHLGNGDKQFISQFDKWIVEAERKENKALDDQTMQALTNSIVLGNG